MLNIVLHQPEIPANTGNIGRTCVATGTVLHLIEPLGFSLSEKQLKRAGMDYWHKLDVRRYINFADFLEKNEGAFASGARLWMAPPRPEKSIPMRPSGRTIISCSAGRARGFRRKSWWNTRTAVSGSPCWTKSVP